jgi:hypothetical protein
MLTRPSPAAWTLFRAFLAERDRPDRFADIAPVLRHVRGCPDVTIVEARPRYYPAPARHLLKLPQIREFATWNLMLLLRRQGDTP